MVNGKTEECGCPEKPTGQIMDGEVWECPQCHTEYVAFVDLEDDVGAVAYWHHKKSENTGVVHHDD